MSSSLLAKLKRARERFRQDVADQLQMAAGKAGLAATVTLHPDRAVLQFEDAPADMPCIVAAFDDDGHGEPNLSDRVSLHVETGEERTMLLSLAWRDDRETEGGAVAQGRLAELEARTDERLPLALRGLNASADRRTGRYAKGDAVRHLIGDLTRVGQHLRGASGPSRALVAIERPGTVLAREAGRGESPERSAGRAPRPAVPDIEVQRANVSELLISSLIQAMQRDLAEAESALVGPGIAAMARGRVGRVMQWAMLGTAYGVEAKTNQMAVASFLGSESASWLYGLVGPVLIGGLPALSKSKLGKGAAYGLMMSWALAMASITASEQGYLDRAQGYFPRQAEVVTHEQAVAAARVRKEGAEAELKRLNAPVKETSALLAEARRRWQAAEIKRAAEARGCVAREGSRAGTASGDRGGRGAERGGAAPAGGAPERSVARVCVVDIVCDLRRDQPGGAARDFARAGTVACGSRGSGSECAGMDTERSRRRRCCAAAARRKRRTPCCCFRRCSMA